MAINDFFRGNTKSYTITIKKNGVAEDITGSTITMTFKKDPNREDASAVIQKNAVLTDPTNGIAVITLEKTDTDVPPQKYYYDIRMTDASGDVTTITKDQVSILQPVNDPD